MAVKKDRKTKPDKTLAAVCGLFCPACTIYIGTQEDPERLKRLAEMFGRPVESMFCDGCRSTRRNRYCDTCKMSKCAAEKGIDFCGECAEFPCEDLKKFQSAASHRLELWKNFERIKQAGFETWYREMNVRYSCPQCGTINSAYDQTCRRCGSSPSCPYVGAHQDEIRALSPKRK